MLPKSTQTPCSSPFPNSCTRPYDRRSLGTFGHTLTQQLLMRGNTVCSLDRYGSCQYPSQLLSQQYIDHNCKCRYQQRSHIPQQRRRYTNAERLKCRQLVTLQPNMEVVPLVYARAHQVGDTRVIQKTLLLAFPMVIR